MSDINAEIEHIETEISQINAQIRSVESSIEDAEVKEVGRAKLERLIQEKKDLREEKKLLLEERKSLRERLGRKEEHMYRMEELREERKLRGELELRSTSATGTAPPQAAPVATVFESVQQPQPPQKLYSVEMMLRDANGQLATLAGYRGFRKYVVDKAMELGVTGTIQRYHHYDIKIYFEGYSEQLDNFFDFFQTCIEQRMIATFDNVLEGEIPRRRQRKFYIVVDHSRTTERNGKVKKGPHSNHTEYDKISDYSADSGAVLGFHRPH